MYLLNQKPMKYYTYIQLYVYIYIYICSRVTGIKIINLWVPTL